MSKSSSKIVIFWAFSGQKMQKPEPILPRPTTDGYPSSEITHWWLRAIEGGTTRTLSHEVMNLALSHTVITSSVRGLGIAPGPFCLNTWVWADPLNHADAWLCSHLKKQWYILNLWRFRIFSDSESGFWIRIQNPNPDSKSRFRIRIQNPNPYIVFLRIWTFENVKVDA